MFNLVLFIVHTALFIWAFGAVGDYSPAPSLVFVAFFAAILAGYFFLRIAAHVCEIFFLTEFLSPKPFIISAGNRQTLIPLSTGNYPFAAVLPRRPAAVVRYSLPKSCWF